MSSTTILNFSLELWCATTSSCFSSRPWGVQLLDFWSVHRPRLCVEPWREWGTTSVQGPAVRWGRQQLRLRLLRHTQVCSSNRCLSIPYLLGSFCLTYWCFCLLLQWPRRFITAKLLNIDYLFSKLNSSNLEGHDRQKEFMIKGYKINVPCKILL